MMSVSSAPAISNISRFSSPDGVNTRFSSPDGGITRFSSPDTNVTQATTKRYLTSKGNELSPQNNTILVSKNMKYQSRVKICPKASFTVKIDPQF